MRKYRLTPKSGRGAVWYTDSISGTYIKAVSADGYETTVDIRMYDIER